MKKLAVVVVTIVLALAVLLEGKSYAGDEGWAAAGGFLGGLVVGSAMSSSPSYYYGRPVYYSYPVYSYPVYPVYSYDPYYYPSYYSGYPVYYRHHHRHHHSH